MEVLLITIFKAVWPTAKGIEFHLGGRE